MKRRWLRVANGFGLLVQAVKRPVCKRFEIQSELSHAAMTFMFTDAHCDSSMSSSSSEAGGPKLFNPTEGGVGKRERMLRPSCFEKRAAPESSLQSNRLPLL